jgi:hypothetical protein
MMDAQARMIDANLISLVNKVHKSEAKFVCNCIDDTLAASKHQTLTKSNIVLVQQ